MIDIEDYIDNVAGDSLIVGALGGRKAGTVELEQKSH
jgi:hypothetical protein